VDPKSNRRFDMYDDDPRNNDPKNRPGGPDDATRTYPDPNRPSEQPNPVPGKIPEPPLPKPVADDSPGGETNPQPTDEGSGQPLGQQR
jgi:hypothetical protein